MSSDQPRKLEREVEATLTGMNLDYSSQVMWTSSSGSTTSFDFVAKSGPKTAFIEVKDRDSIGVSDILQVASVSGELTKTFTSAGTFVVTRGAVTGRAQEAALASGIQIVSPEELQKRLKDAFK